jgi:hypothetical protein
MLPMPPQLLALGEGPNIPLDRPIVLVGRHQECDVQIASRKISRRHCCIAQVSNYLVVRDLGSTNGVRVNGTRVIEAALQAGDELVIGNMRYTVRWDDHHLATRPAPPAPPRRVPRPAELSVDEPIPLMELDAPADAPQARPAMQYQIMARGPRPQPPAADDDEPLELLPLDSPPPSQ